LLMCRKCRERGGAEPPVDGRQRVKHQQSQIINKSCQAKSKETVAEI